MGGFKESLPSDLQLFAGTLDCLWIRSWCCLEVAGRERQLAHRLKVPAANWTGPIGLAYFVRLMASDAVTAGLLRRAIAGPKVLVKPALVQRAVQPLPQRVFDREAVVPDRDDVLGLGVVENRGGCVWPRAFEP